MGYTARWVWEELDTTGNAQGGEISAKSETEPDLSPGEVSALIASGTLTEEAWNAHLQGMKWEIRLSAKG